jgi:hypothetical protein
VIDLSKIIKTHSNIAELFGERLGKDGTKALSFALNSAEI